MKKAREAAKKLLIVVGSAHDTGKLNEVKKLLRLANITFAVQVISVHRNVKILVEILDPMHLEKQGIGCVLAVAHSVANLPAIIAGYLKGSCIPVVGVGLANSDTDKIESLLSVISIPRGVPLVHAGINEVGLYNATLACIKILNRL